MKGRDRPLEPTRSPSRTLMVVATCLLVALALLAIGQTPALGVVRGGLELAVAPIQQAVSGATYGVNSWIETANTAHTQTAEIQALKERIAQLETENARLGGIDAEKQTLLTMLGFQQEHPELHSLPANVIGRDPNGLARIFLLDRGSNDGVGLDMAVTSPGGYLLGRVSKVTARTATVLLIDDVDSTIPIMVDRTRVQANVQGQNQHGGSLLVVHIPQGADVARGDLIKTSGLGGTLPKGLLLGQVYEMHQKDIDQEQQAVAAPYANSDTISQALVILSAGGPGDAPRPAASPLPGGGSSPSPNSVGTGTPTPGIAAPLYPVPATATPPPTRTPLPTFTLTPRVTPTAVPTATRTPTAKKKP